MMSYPTPWIVDYDGDVIDADGDIVIEGRAANWDLRIKLDDLVSRINAGAEAEARAERAEKALATATQGMRIVPGARLIPERIVLNGQTIARTDDVTAAELTAYLKEKEEKL